MNAIKIFVGLGILICSVTQARAAESNPVPIQIVSEKISEVLGRAEARHDLNSGAIYSFSREEREGGKSSLVIKKTDKTGTVSYDFNQSFFNYFMWEWSSNTIADGAIFRNEYACHFESQKCATLTKPVDLHPNFFKYGNPNPVGFKYFNNRLHTLFKEESTEGYSIVWRRINSKDLSFEDTLLKLPYEKDNAFESFELSNEDGVEKLMIVYRNQQDYQRVGYYFPKVFKIDRDGTINAYENKPNSGSGDFPDLLPDGLIFNLNYEHTNRNHIELRFSKLSNQLEDFWSYTLPIDELIIKPEFGRPFYYVDKKIYIQTSENLYEISPLEKKVTPVIYYRPYKLRNYGHASVELLPSGIFLTTPYGDSEFISSDEHFTIGYQESLLYYDSNSKVLLTYKRIPKQNRYQDMFEIKLRNLRGEIVSTYLVQAPKKGWGPEGGVLYSSEAIPLNIVALDKEHLFITVIKGDGFGDSYYSKATLKSP